MWPWKEEINYEAEYKRSLQNLQHFISEVDVSKLSTLEDVSAVVSLVGHDLHIIAITQGKHIEKAPKYLVSWAIEPTDNSESGSGEYAYTISFDDREVVVTTSEGHSVIAEHRTIGFQHFQREELRVKLPSDRDIAFGNMPNVEEQSLYAIDLRSGHSKEYHPVREPDNADVQQSFVALLNEVMQDVVSSLPLL